MIRKLPWLKRVPDEDYRGTFLKLTRSLAPIGKDFSVLTTRRSSMDADSMMLTEDSRKEISTIIRQQFTKQQVTGETPGELRGVLRALHLDEDWLEVTVAGQHVRVFDVGETVDDLVGPLVNPHEPGTGEGNGTRSVAHLSS